MNIEKRKFKDAANFHMTISVKTAERADFAIVATTAESDTTNIQFSLYNYNFIKGKEK